MSINTEAAQGSLIMQLDSAKATTPAEPKEQLKDVFILLCRCVSRDLYKNRRLLLIAAFLISCISTAYFVTTAKAEFEITYAEKKIIAAHEVGHAFVQASLGSIPDDVKIVVNSKVDHNSRLGYVRAALPMKRVLTKQAFEWRLMAMLAGQVSERIILDKSTVGSFDDNDKWVAKAKIYLRNNFEGIFYNDPENKFEQQANENKLETFRNEQRNKLRNFFEINKVVLNELYQELLKKEVLHKNDLIPFYERATIPKDFPKPLGDFDKFSVNWEEKGAY